MNGRLAAQEVVGSAGSTYVYRNQTDRYSTVSLNLVNTGTGTTAVRVAISQSLTPINYIEYDTAIPQSGSLLRNGLALNSGDYLLVESSAENVSAVVWGIEPGTFQPDL